LIPLLHKVRTYKAGIPAQVALQVDSRSAPSSSATARQGVMRSAHDCQSRALRQALSATRCGGPAGAAPQRHEPQLGDPALSRHSCQIAHVFHAMCWCDACLLTAPGIAAARRVGQAARVGGCMCGGSTAPACAAQFPPCCCGERCVTARSLCTTIVRKICKDPVAERRAEMLHCEHATSA
jgi:hypothetical protein